MRSLKSKFRRAPVLMMRAWLGVLVIGIVFAAPATAFAATQQEAADYVRDNVLGGSFGTVTLWMTDTALTGEGSGGTVHLARGFHAEELFPFPLTWLVMIDDEPEANWAHPCRWVFIEEDEVTGELTPNLYIVVNTDWFPTVWEDAGFGSEVDFGCVPVTDTACPELSVYLPPGIPGQGGLEKAVDQDCLYAVLISGGWKKGKCVTKKCVGGANKGNLCTKLSDCPDGSCETDTRHAVACDSIVDCNPPNGNFCEGSKNHDRYKTNLVSMYQKLRACGFPADQIYTYYDNGDGLDLDDADGDGNPRTGSSEVTDKVIESKIRLKITTLCATLDQDRDVLVIYTTNHGETTVCRSGINFGKPCKANGECAADPGTCTDGRCVGGKLAKSTCANDGECSSPMGTCDGLKGVVLWDFDGDGADDDNESYETDEFDADTTNCKVCRLFVIMDQCHSGQFTGIAGDGAHTNTVIYAAAEQDEPSWGREYMARWEREQNDPATTDINDMHQDVEDNGNLRSTASKKEGTPGNGDVSLCFCWELPPVCGNGICEAGEDCETCPEDCAECEEDADCDDGDACTTDNCLDECCLNEPIDCPEGEVCLDGDCVIPACGNGVCEPGETCEVCSEDCGTCFCGNGSCDPGEDCETCEEDCPCEEGEVCVDGECVNIIPTVSEWGLIVMTLLALTAGTIVFARRRRPTLA